MELEIHHEGGWRACVRRDLLNLALGNRDNHGRNTALLKDVDGTQALAPIFDFGPSFLDARALARVIHWDGEEPGGARGWRRIMANLDTRFTEAGLEPPGTLFEQAIRKMLPQLDTLPAVLRECGVDEDLVIQRVPVITELAAGLRGAVTSA